ncbi:MAG: hypothetical protein NTV86_16750 [Planctomycetota bacterium]|nr:hypothetical protein [Planctomycetota bacterium]
MKPILTAAVALLGVGRHAFGAAVLPLSTGLLCQAGDAGPAKIAYDESNIIRWTSFRSGLAGFCLFPSGTVSARLLADGGKNPPAYLNYTRAAKPAEVADGANLPKPMFFTANTPGHGEFGGTEGPNHSAQGIRFGGDERAGRPGDPAATHPLADGSLLGIGLGAGDFAIGMHADSGQPVRAENGDRFDAANIGGASAWTSGTREMSYLRSAAPGAVTSAR